MEKNEETKTVILTEEFKESLSRFFSVPTARQMESMFEFAIGSIAATGEREGWNEGVADGLCRQVTKLIEAEVIQDNWGRKVSSRFGNHFQCEQGMGNQGINQEYYPVRVD